MSSPASCALEESLRRALRKQKVVCKNPKKQKAVHDLRVSLRRCRSLAENFSELDLHPVWRHLAKACKTQQQGLNDPRDAHVIAGWTHKLKLDRPSSGRVFAETIKKEEHGSRRKATKSLGNFPRKRWKHWLHSLPARADMIPVGESRLALLALERLGEAEGFERHWRKTRSVAAWHKLRVAVKRFRYTVESFLPEQHVVSEKALKRLQDILGDGHDLDVLRERILQFARDTDMRQATRDRSLRRVERARRQSVEDYETAISARGKPRHGKKQPGRSGKSMQRIWDRWRAGLGRLAQLNPSDAATPGTSSARRG